MHLLWSQILPLQLDMILLSSVIDLLILSLSFPICKTEVIIPTVNILVRKKDKRVRMPS